MGDCSSRGDGDNHGDNDSEGGNDGDGDGDGDNNGEGEGEGEEKAGTGWMRKEDGPTVVDWTGLDCTYCGGIGEGRR